MLLTGLLVLHIWASMRVAAVELVSCSSACESYWECWLAVGNISFPRFRKQCPFMGRRD